MIKQKFMEPVMKALVNNNVIDIIEDNMKPFKKLMAYYNIYLKDGKKNMRVEVQLRTIAMDFGASLDHKLSYNKEIPDGEANILKRELLECAQASSELDRRMEDIKNRIVNK